MIEIDKATKRYGRKLAVDELSLEIPSGEIFAFLGHNGAGKTTTIKMLVGLLRPTSGTLRINGIDVVKQPRDSNSLLGYVPDQPYLYDKLTGREMLQFIAEMYGQSKEECEASIQSQIDAFELESFVDRLSESYSHGMKQRLVFASALVHKPSVLIVDEPMVGLDPRSARLVKDLLREEADHGTTVFMSTHTLTVAEEIADRIGIIEQGKIRFLGTMDQLRQTMDDEHTTLEQMYLRLTGNPESSNGAIHEENVELPEEPSATETA